MKHLVQLFIAIVLAGFAGLANWYWMNSHRDYPQYVSAAQVIDGSVEIAAEMLRPVPVPGDPTVLSKTLIPWRDAYITYGRTARRTLQPGDAVLYSDFQPEHAVVEWEYIGPFTLVGVGEDVAEPMRGEQDMEGGGGSDIITIAVPSEMDEKTKRLLRYQQASRGEFYAGESSEEQQRMRIAAIMVAPPTQTAPANQGRDPKTHLRPEEVMHFVSLEGIDNVPRFLLVGQEVYFAVPSEPRLPDAR